MKRDQIISAKSFFIILAFSVLLFYSIAFAEELPSDGKNRSDREVAKLTETLKEARDAFAAAQVVMQPGPNEISLADQARLKLPEGFVFVPSKEAKRIIESLGDPTTNDILGLVFPYSDPNARWMVSIQFHRAGYLRDDDANDLDPNELLEQIKIRTDEDNKVRREKGIPEIEVIGWIEEPHYDVATHQLIWSVSAKDKGATVNSPTGINYNTIALGREGFVAMNLVTEFDRISVDKTVARTLLSALEFNPEKSYGDFNAATDKVAEFGLVALIAGLAAKKLGLFAILAAIALKFAKLVGVGIFAALGYLLRRFRKNRSSEPASAESNEQEVHR